MERGAPFLVYSLEWSRAVNNGGLFEINDETFHLFQAIELDIQKHLLSTLTSFPDKSEDRRQFIVDAVAADTDVQFVCPLIIQYQRRGLCNLPFKGNHGVVVDSSWYFYSFSQD